MKNRYLSDYTLEEQLDEKTGRLKRVPVYRGSYFMFCLTGVELKKTKLLYIGLTIVCVCSLLAALTVNAPCGHYWYVMLPMAVMVFPLFFQIESCLLLYIAKDKVERSARDKIEQRTVVTSVFLAVFSLFSLAGHVVFMILYEESSRDVVYFVSAAVILSLSLIMIGARRGLRMMEIS